ncbi:MAG: phosphoenolpyruvate synthase, partial [Patescibacteria group bacterium]
TERISFVLSDAEVKMLAVWGVIIEEHYSQRAGKWTPMDIEWARDGVTKELFIVQARPETVHSERDYSKIVEYTRTGEGTPIVRGASVGNKIATGKARVIMNVKDMNSFKKGEVLVTDMTDPNWEPIMKIASAIVTDKGGRTSHAAIVSRELGIPAVVGTEHATQVIKTGDALTVDTSGSEGLVFRGTLAFTVEERDVKALPKTRTKIMVNIATPETAFEKSFLPHQGVGLAREEFIIASTIGIHPMALLNFKKLPKKIQEEIRVRISGWDDPVDYYVDQLAYGIARIGLAFAPHHVIVRFSDFKTNEYRALLGGELYEPHEENPMLGWRGASRYYDEKFKSAFLLECRAIARVRGEMGLMNVIPMVPFCRTPEEGERVLMTMAEGGLVSRYAAKRGHTVVGEPMPVYVMCEIPANILLADRFLDLFDGMSIGSNDLTQLVLGLDRDSGIVNHVADEQNQAVKEMVRTVIDRCRSRRKYIGICGQAPSDHPDFARFLVEAGIESMSLNPDTVISTTLIVAKEERDRWSV